MWELVKLNHHRLKPVGLGWLLKQPKVVRPRSYRSSFVLLYLDFWYILVWSRPLRSHCWLQNILLPIDGGPRTPYSTLFIPSVVFGTCSPSYTGPACLPTDVAVLIPGDVCDPSLHTRPESPHHLSGISSGSVLLFLPRSFPSARVFGILLSIQYGIWYHTCNGLIFYSFPFSHLKFSISTFPFSKLWGMGLT